MRSERLGEEIRRELAEILHGRVRDPDLGDAGVTRVEVSPDGSHARVYISFLGDEAAQVRGLRALERAGGFVRRELAQRLPVRRVPELAFHRDRGIEHSLRVQRELRELGFGGAEEASGPAPGPSDDAPAADAGQPGEA
jgi:ribosome-binding factor A